MKKTINKLFSLIAIALLLASCTAIDHDTDTAGAILQARNTLTGSVSHHLGQSAAGSDVLNLRLTSEGVSADYIVSAGKIVDNTYKGTGYIISIDSLFVDPLVEPGFPVGTFDIKTSFSAGSQPAIFFITLHNGSTAAAAEKVRLVDGTVIVTKAGDNYTVAINATSIAGVKLETTFSGKIEVADAVYVYESLTPTTQDIAIDDISFTSKNSDLDSDHKMDVSLATLTLTGPTGLIVINEIAGPLYAIGAEPKRPAPGTYNLTRWTYAEKTFTPGEIYKGKLTGSYAWLLSNPATPSFSEIWYFANAQMEVIETATVYKIVITAESVNGSTITATYEEKQE
jgi:hypothetical protein